MPVFSDMSGGWTPLANDRAALNREMQRMKLHESNQRSDQERVKAKFDALVSKHIKTLARKRTQLVVIDDYGIVESNAWIQEVGRFYAKVILPTLTKEDIRVVVALTGPYVLTNWIERPARIEAERLEQEIGKATDIEALNPLEYERYCASILEGRGWQCKLTPSTGDQGADVLATKGKITIAIQCKKYSSNVGNTAVQEVVAAKIHFRATHAVVVTNAGYTRSAVQLAKTTGTLLISHANLIDIDTLVTKRA